jgi:hypothetical protein
MKILQQLAETSEQKALQIMSITAIDLRKNQEFVDMPATVGTKDLARILIMQKVVKIFQNALILLVNTNIRNA